MRIIKHRAGGYTIITNKEPQKQPWEYQRKKRKKSSKKCLVCHERFSTIADARACAKTDKELKEK